AARRVRRPPRRTSRGRSDTRRRALDPCRRTASPALERCTQSLVGYRGCRDLAPDSLDALHAAQRCAGHRVDGDPNHIEFKLLDSTCVLFRVQWTCSSSSTTARASRPRYPPQLAYPLI